MALLQISEPGMSTAPHEHRLAAGIDLGTTNSLVASVRSGTAETLSDENGDTLLPSVVQYLKDAQPIVGKKAKDNQLNDIANTISSAKRILGRGIDDIKTLDGNLPYHFVDGDSNVPQIQTVAGNITAIEVSAEIPCRKGT
ncbi:MAG: hypothetical protein DSY57_03875 [Desulfobulbus sp.]|nr:MAG: hypothetical protein DSY57_03875 [Desulfobulbus sp.]